MIFKTLVFLFLFFLEGYCALQEVIDFKKTVTAVIDVNNIEEVHRVGDKACRMKGTVIDSVARFVEMAQANALPPKWIDWFQRTFERHGNIGQRAFAAAIFYPYELMEASYKYHISQMSPILKACLYYSLKLDPEGLWGILDSKRTDCSIASDENLLDWLDITFVAHNGAFTEKAREYLMEGDNLDRLFAHIMGEGKATQLFNFGVIAKSLGRVGDMAIPCFSNAAGQGSRRAALEWAYHDIENGADVVGRLSSLGSYGVWKIAQCFRYGKKVARDLKVANGYYLEALAGIDEFPEIAYDAGDFVEELALGQKDRPRFESTARKAIGYFCMAGDRHLGSGYIRAARLMITARERYPDLAGEFNDDAISDLAFRAAQQGSYEKAKSLLERIRKDPSGLLTPGTVGISKFVKDINEKFG